MNQSTGVVDKSFLPLDELLTLPSLWWIIISYDFFYSISTLLSNNVQHHLYHTWERATHGLIEALFNCLVLIVSYCSVTKYRVFGSTLVRSDRVIECDVKWWCFNPYTTWALALQMEMGPHKDRGKLWPGWELNPRPSGLITAVPPTELQGQTGAGRGKWRC